VRAHVRAATTPYPCPQALNPCSGFYYVGNCCGPTCGNQTAYFQLYATLSSAVKSVHPALQVGGPATAQVGWVPEFLAWTRSAGAAVDFVSTHLYPTDPSVPVDRDGFASVINNTAALAAAAGLPLLMTEFNSGLGIPNGQVRGWSQSHHAPCVQRTCSPPPPPPPSL